MKRMKKLLVTLLAGIMVLSSLTISAGAKEDEYDVFLAFGADKETGDWGYQYYGTGAETNAGDVQGVDEKISVGETVTISATLPTETVYTWFMAPCLVAENVTALDATITCKIDGTDVTDTIDFAAGDAWWYEGTAAYDETQCIRLAGGYNEWGTKYMATSPVFTTVEYTITLNSIEVGDGTAAATELADFEGEAPVFVAIGADKEAGDWGYQYYGAGAETNAGDVTGVDGTISVGGTTTVSVEFPTASVYTWFVAPCVIAEGVVEADFTVQVFVDGTEVTPDFAAGDAWWYEGTAAYDETQCIRLAGGYNEWGTKYIAESPANFSKIEFVITCNSMKVGVAAPTEDATTAAAVDKNGVYHAYLGFQTPVYSFRNSFDDATYGRDTDFFNQITGWADNEAVAIPGTFTDVEIAGNGTYTVSVEGMEFPAGEFDTQDYMNLIFLSTDIPNSGEITISNVILKVNDKTVDLAENIGAIVSPDSVNYLNMLLQNVWNDDVKTIGAYSVPPTSMSITFDVAGFDYDNTATVTDDTAAADDTAAVTDTVEESSSNSTVIIIVVIAVVVIAVVVVAVVLGKKKKAQ